MQDDLQIQVTETGVDTGTGADIRLSGQNITDAYNQLETNLTNAVNTQLNTIGTNATAKGAMLTPTAPTQGISSYDYNRWVAPNLNATIASLRETGAITAGLQTLNNMKADAEANYNKAVEAAKARATAAASGGGGGGGGLSDTVTGATTKTTDDPANPPSTWTEKQKLDMINSLAHDDPLKMIEYATQYGISADELSALNQKYYPNAQNQLSNSSQILGGKTDNGGVWIDRNAGTTITRGPFD